MSPGRRVAGSPGRRVAGSRFLRLRPVLAAALLGLPVLAGLATGAQAQTPTVTISSVGGPIDEGGRTIVRISLDRAVSGSLYVPVRGRRADGSVYGQTAYVANGKKSGMAIIRHNDDDIWQPEEHYDMPVWLSSRIGYRGSHYHVGAGSRQGDTTHSVRVDDNDPLTARFDKARFGVDERAVDSRANALLRFSPDPGRGKRPEVSFSVSGTATQGDDYVFFHSDTITTNGDIYTSSYVEPFFRNRLIVLKMINDDVKEGTETAILTLEPGKGYVVGGDRDAVTIEIDDDETSTAIYELSLSASRTSVTEGDSGDTDLTVNMALSRPSIQLHTQSFMICLTGDAESGTDYELVPRGGIRDISLLSHIPANFPPGCRRAQFIFGSESGSFDVRVKGDMDPESDETVTITARRLVNTDDYDLAESFGISATAGSVDLVIKDDDGNSAPTVANAIPDGRATVGMAFSHRFPADAFSDPDGDPLTYAATRGDGTALPSWLTFDSGTRTFSGTPGSGDAGTLTVRVTAGDGNGGTVTDEFDIVIGTTPPPVATFESAASSFGEDAGSQSVRVDLSRPATEAFTLHYTVGGTAGSGDFSIVGSGSAKVHASWTGVNIPVAITDDTSDEAAETVILTLSEGTGYLLGSGTVHTLTIEDDDEPRPGDQIVSVSAGAESVAEGSDAAFTLTRTGLALSPLTVRLSVAETSAGGGDFVASGDEGNVEAVFPAGSSSVTYNVPTQDDGTDEPDGGVRVTVMNGTGYLRDSSNHAASMAVTDDDATEVRLSASPDDIAENGGTKALTVRLGRALVAKEALAVPLVFSDGARRGTDYTVSCAAATGVTCHKLGNDDDGRPLPRPRIDFTGPSAQSVTLTLTATDDVIDEGLGERVSVGFGTLDATSGTNLAGGATGIGTAAFRIDDDDTTPPPEVSVAAGTASITEGGDAAFTVTASRAPDADLTVRLTVSEAEGSDFVAADSEGAATVTIPKGKTEAAFTVATVDDNADEPNGSVTATLAGNGGAYTVAA
ncbi:MAG: putative Ig domain-containing protein, partial [Boseongicola sp.]|nr:putative Ig domain-containing protein [Boseongicola sp.]